MRGRPTPKKKPAKSKETHHCGECKRAEWVTDDFKHLDHDGKPICLKCPFSKHYVVRSQKACDEFE